MAVSLSICLTSTNNTHPLSSPLFPSLFPSPPLSVNDLDLVIVDLTAAATASSDSTAQTISPVIFGNSQGFNGDAEVARRVMGSVGANSSRDSLNNVEQITLLLPLPLAPAGGSSTAPRHYALIVSAARVPLPLQNFSVVITGHDSTRVHISGDVSSTSAASGTSCAGMLLPSMLYQRVFAFNSFMSACLPSTTTTN